MTFGSVHLIKFLTLRGDSLYWSNLLGFNKGALSSFTSPLAQWFVTGGQVEERPSH